MDLGFTKIIFKISTGLQSKELKMLAELFQEKQTHQNLGSAQQLIIDWEMIAEIRGIFLELQEDQAVEQALLQLQVFIQLLKDLMVEVQLEFLRVYVVYMELKELKAEFQENTVAYKVGIPSTFLAQDQ